VRLLVVLLSLVLAARGAASAESGELHVDGAPAGATIHITGPGGFSAEGELPFVVHRCTPGRYRLTVTQDGYAEQVVSAKVRPGQPTSITITLALVRPSPVGGSAAPEGGGVGVGERRTSRAPPLDVPVGLTTKEVGAIVKAHMKEIRACYERELAHDATLTGKVSVRWSVGARGRVSDAEVTASELHNGAAETCVLNAVRALSFPDPKNGAIIAVTYPFVFKPE
jgi:TonB family protein